MRPFSVKRGKHISPEILPLEKEYIPETEDDLKNDYNPFSLTQIQSYIPLYSAVLDISPEDGEKIALNNTYEFCNLTTVFNKEDPSFPKLQKDVFIKFSPLLDPIKYMTGKYERSNIVLPSIMQTEVRNAKIENINNASYVDGFFCYLSSQLMHAYHIPHCIGFYGSHLAFQRKFKMVMDELDYLMGSPYFLSNVNRLFFISGDAVSPNASVVQSRNNKPKLHFENDDTLDLDVIEVAKETTVRENATETIDLVYHKSPEEEEKEECDSDSCVSSENSLLNYSSESESDNEDDNNDESGSDIDNESESGTNESSDDEDGSESGSDTNESSDDEDGSESGSSSDTEDEPDLYAYINDFPVQMICLEKCAGTLDELIMKGEIDEYKGASALFQIIMTLIIYQKAFHLTHNDLHTNNVMYVSTEEEYLYYNYNGNKYRVPTYGRIYKIIDFGRSIYEWNGRRFCSDSFQNGGDAATQYNCEPFFDENKPRLEPNYSFDLCRLGVSIYDFVIDDDESPEDMDDFQRIVYKWCIDDNGKNILYKKNGEERYPNFKLYKMIARTVHNYSPETQLGDPLFRDFRVSNTKWEKIRKNVAQCIDIDRIPFLGTKE